MVLNIVTDGGFDFGLAIDAGDQVIMAQLPADELNQLSNSAFPDAIALGGGNDVFENDNMGRIVFGNTGNDSLVAGAGGDTIYGGQGEDTIIGGAGNDVLSGDRNFDTLTGGGGADEFIMPSSGDHRDLITDFQPGVDKLRLPDGVAFTDLQLRDSAGNAEIVRNGQVLTVLNGVVASSITTNDFIGEIGETPPVEVTPGNTPSTAGDLGVFTGNRTVEDFVGSTDPNDYYRFTLDQVHDVELTLFGMSQNANLQLYIGEQKPDGSVEIGDRIESSSSSFDRDDSISRSLGAGTYFVRVNPAFSTVDTRYSLTFEANPTGILDQAGNTSSSALDLGILEGERNFQDFVGTADNNDYYRFTLNEVRDVNLDLFGMSQNANLQLYIGEQNLNGSWELGDRIESSSSSFDRDDSISRSLGAGTYFVRVNPAFSTVDTKYRLRLNATA